MKEVCGRTGLTERTIRYYVEEGLIHPEVAVRGGREYREYSEQDVAQLLTIAGLRKLFFTIDEIKDMQHEPDRIGDVLAAYKLKLATDAKAKAAIVTALDQIEWSELSHIDLIAERLKSLSANLPLPQRDINPNFGKFEQGSKQEREREYQQFLQRQQKQFQRGKVIVITIATVNIALSILSLFSSFNLFSLIIQIILSICLLAGVTWVRYLFAIGAVLSAIIGIWLVSALFAEGMTGAAWFYTFHMFYSAVVAVLLFKSDAVSEYLYAQKNG